MIIIMLYISLLLYLKFFLVLLIMIYKGKFGFEFLYLGYNLILREVREVLI